MAFGLATKIIKLRNIIKKLFRRRSVPERKRFFRSRNIQDILLYLLATVCYRVNDPKPSANLKPNRYGKQVFDHSGQSGQHLRPFLQKLQDESFVRADARTGCREHALYRRRRARRYVGHPSRQCEGDEKAPRRLRSGVRVDHPRYVRRQRLRQGLRLEHRSGRAAQGARLSEKHVRSGVAGRLPDRQSVDGSGRLRLSADGRLRPRAGVDDRGDPGAGFRVPVAEDRVGVQAQGTAQLLVPCAHGPIRFWLLRKPAAGTWA